VVLSPLLVLIAVMVKLDSRGPVFFRQTRVGRDGRPFEIWKFRSMVDGADAQKEQLHEHNEAGAGLFKIADDPRRTRIGRFIRRLSLDELPQLLNVLRGEMSLVGPRPLVCDEDEQIVGWDRRRLQLTPGMTGHWQILGSSRVPMAEMVKLDYLYVAGWSLWSDVKILLRTLAHVRARRGL
jgi:lipopolysaccharide/colanic/teichoic acid biosynthesis glycosyltransferase